MSTRYTIELSSGIAIRLHALFQHYTYGGLMDGLPSRRLNQRLVDAALKTARERLWLDSKPVVIPPVETSMGLPKSDWVYPADEFEPRSIPGVTCMATFESSTPARDEEADMSTLNIVWFQEELALPIDPAVMEEICALDWRAMARDGNY